MNSKNIYKALISIIALAVISGCSAKSTPQPSHPDAPAKPASGSSESAGPTLSSIDFANTDLIPQNFLEDTGIIMGTWFSEKKPEELKVSVDDQITRSKDCRKWPEDCLTISFPESTNVEPFSFKAANGDFVLYGFDTDGDGIKEILIESIENRESDVKTLRVIKFVKGELAEVFRAPLNGSFSNASEKGNGFDTVPWERKYGLKGSFTGKRLDIVLYLTKPDEKLKAITQLSDLFIYQCKKIIATYDDKNATYIIKSADPLPIGK